MNNITLNQRALPALWSLATAIATGVGWYWGSLYRQWLIIGVLLGVCQALVLLPRWRLAGRWLAATILGWVFAYSGIWLAGALIGHANVLSLWVTVNSDDIAWALALLPFVGVPILAFTQTMAIAGQLKSEPWIYWFGVPVCSFPLALFAVFALFDPRIGHFFIPALAPSFWLLGALWGACTGWAIFRSQEFQAQSPENSSHLPDPGLSET